MTNTPTDEQQAVIDASLEGDHLVIQAGAGPGRVQELSGRYQGAQEQLWSLAAAAHLLQQPGAGDLRDGGVSEPVLVAESRAKGRCTPAGGRRE